MRTRTAVINASMLPRMLETADRTEQAVRESGIGCPLMVMRSDGGIMDIAQMRRRPILTMLSGPAAGVAAALAFVKISDGIFLEVGGTSTDISVVRNGRPTVRSAELGGYRLFMRTLDIRTVGIGGGSMARVSDGRVVDVGPRSAHIAGLGYPSFTPLPADATFSSTSVAPKAGDPGDYLGIRVSGAAGPSLAYTTTDAANALGLVMGHAKATSDAGTRVTSWLASRFNTSPDAFARAVLDRAADRVAEAVDAFIVDYGLERRDVTLVGGGGGAEVIASSTARAMDLQVRIADRAEVISAIGVALGMIQDTVERTVINPTEADVVAIRRAAMESVLSMGAVAESVEVKVEVDTRQKRLVATARGTPELRTRDLGSQARSEGDLREIAARSSSVPVGATEVIGRAGTLWVFRGREVERRWWGLRSRERHPVRAIDHEGVVRLKVPDAVTLSATLSELAGQLSSAVEDLTVYGDAGGLVPDVFLVVSGRLVDLSGLASRDQVLSLVRAEGDTLGGDEPAIAVLARKRA